MVLLFNSHHPFSIRETMESKNIDETVHDVQMKRWLVELLALTTFAIFPFIPILFIRF